MSMRRPSLLAALLTAALLPLSVAGCGDAEMDEVPETAEVEADPAEPGLELDEELMIGADDVGETIMATGYVAGMTADGFFMRTEADRLIFVESPLPVTVGDAVRATGVVDVTTRAVFEGWEADAFDTGFEAEWDVISAHYIANADATLL